METDHRLMRMAMRAQERGRHIGVDLVTVVDAAEMLVQVSERAEREAPEPMPDGARKHKENLVESIRTVRESILAIVEEMLDGGGESPKKPDWEDWRRG